MTICNQCGGYVPDIGGHQCFPRGGYYPPIPYYIPPTNQGQKCDICGSTAIDHTEAQCQLNRVLKNNLGQNTVGVRQEAKKVKKKVGKD